MVLTYIFKNGHYRTIYCLLVIYYYQYAHSILFTLFLNCWPLVFYYVRLMGLCEMYKMFQNNISNY